MTERTVNIRKINELIAAVANQDGVNTGVAKARISSESSYSVSLLEKLMRGGSTSDLNQQRTVAVAKKRGLAFEIDDLFPPVSAGEDEAS